MSLSTLICTKCKEEKPTSAFSRDRTRQSRNGYHAWCKSCRNNQNNAAYSKQIARYEAEQHLNVPPTLFCRRCNEVKPTTAFPIDKRNKANWYRNTLCQSCKLEMHKLWRDANKAHVNAYGRKHAVIRRARNPEYFRQRDKRKSAEFRAKNPTYQSDWTAQHPGYSTAASIKYAQRHPEKFRAKKRRLSITYIARRRARQRALPATFTLAEEAFCRAYFHQACAVCGNEEGFRWTIAMDHWIPLSSPDCPGTIAANMIPLCHGRGGCNNTSKRHKLPDVWLTERFGPRKAARILKKIHAYFALVKES